MMNRTTMQTYTGALVDLQSFSHNDVRLPDIAHSLALINRYTGHTLMPYSVAQHSVMVSLACSKENALWGLLHDASEAYLGDVASPLKHMLPQYRTLEQHFQRQIAKRFGLVWPMPQEVHEADLKMLMAEKSWLMSVEHDWGIDAEPARLPRIAWNWNQAQVEFEKRAKEILQ